MLTACYLGIVCFQKDFDLNICTLHCVHFMNIFFIFSYIIINTL